MADDFQDDYEGFDEGMLEWFYLEEDYPLADELAETQVPSPGYAGTQYEIDRESWDFDMFDYWDDLQYGDDEYWDYSGINPSAVGTGQKRKRNASGTAKFAEKRRKLSLEETSGDNVRFVSIAVRNEMARRPPPLSDGRTSFALLPDWKQRFANESGVVSAKTMPKEMKQAAESKDTDSPPKKTQVNAVAEMEDNDEDEWVDESEGDEDDDDDEAEDSQHPLASLDPEILKGFLRQEFGNGGMEGIDENAFMQTIEKMLSGGQDADAAIADLASSLLGQATGGQDAALSGWLSQQGVSLDDAEDDEDNESCASISDFPATSKGKPAIKNVQASPPDSAIEMLKGGTSTTEMAIHLSSPSASGKKRMAPAEDQDGAKKKKKVTFDVPPSSESTQTANEALTDSTAKPEALDPPTSEDPLMSETTIHDETIISNTKAANGAAVKNNKTKSASGIGTAKSKSKSTRQQNTKAETAQTKANVTESEPAKQTRKRKARADEDEVDNMSPAQKKQTKNDASSAVAIVEPPAKRTRSARAKAGK